MLFWSDSFPAKAGMSATSTTRCNSYTGEAYWLVDCRPGSGRWRSISALSLLTNWCYTKMAKREILIMCTLYWIIRPYCLQYIIKTGWWMSKI